MLLLHRTIKQQNVKTRSTVCCFFTYAVRNNNSEIFYKIKTPKLTQNIKILKKSRNFSINCVCFIKIKFNRPHEFGLAAEHA